MSESQRAFEWSVARPLCWQVLYTNGLLLGRWKYSSKSRKGKVLIRIQFSKHSVMLPQGIVATFPSVGSFTNSWSWGFPPCLTWIPATGEKWNGGKHTWRFEHTNMYNTSCAFQIVRNRLISVLLPNSAGTVIKWGSKCRVSCTNVEIFKQT